MSVSWSVSNISLENRLTHPQWLSSTQQPQLFRQGIKYQVSHSASWRKSSSTFPICLAGLHTARSQLHRDRLGKTSSSPPPRRRGARRSRLLNQRPMRPRHHSPTIMNLRKSCWRHEVYTSPLCMRGLLSDSRQCYVKKRDKNGTTEGSLTKSRP